MGVADPPERQKPGPARPQPAGGPATASPARLRSRQRLPAAFQSLRHPNYRLLWLGSVVSNSGDWMDQVALNWLVYQLTGSAVQLALLNFCRLAPIFVFTLIGGVVADRVERRRLMFTTQSVAAVLALALAAVTALGLVQLWMVLVIAVGRGIVLSFNQPARQSLISELVPREDLKNAIALNSATLNLTRVLGPTIGGLLIATVGVAGAFYLNAVTFVAVLWALTQMKFVDRPSRNRRASMASELAGGLKYIYGRPLMRTLVGLALAPMIFGMPYQTMLTVFASDVFKVGGGGLGLLTACSGVGSVAGALYVASSGNNHRLGRLMLTGLLIFGMALMVFALSPWFWASVAALVVVGVGQQVYVASNNTLIQMLVDEEYRGRVLSTLFLNRSMVPLGTILAGLGTSLIGAPVTTAAMAGTLVLMALWLWRSTPVVASRN